MEKIKVVSFGGVKSEITSPLYFNEVVRLALSFEGLEGEFIYHLRIISHDCLFELVRSKGDGEGIYLKKYIVLKRYDEDEIMELVENILMKCEADEGEKMLENTDKYFMSEDEAWNLGDL